MNRKLLSLFLLFAMVGLAVFAVAAYRSKQRAEVTPQSSALDSDSAEPGRVEEVAEAATMGQTSGKETVRQEQQVTRQREQTQNRTSPPFSTRTCLDSDADFGDEDIFVRGFVDVKSDLDAGTARVTDHCRLGQLVEFVCIENPQGSGRFISDARLIDCPGGSRCVGGECLQ
jgi:hypothetical protein